MPALAAHSLSELLGSLAAKTPAPGGGAAASSAAALGAALGRMVVAYSVGKKALEAHRPTLDSADAALERFAAMFLELAEEDAAAYALVTELRALPEIDARRIRELPLATAAAIAAPRNTLAACCDLLRLLESLIRITNTRLHSDLAVAAILADAGARSAWWNVQVNLPSVESDVERDALRTAADSMRELSLELCAKIEHSCGGPGAGQPKEKEVGRS